LRYTLPKYLITLVILSVIFVPIALCIDVPIETLERIRDQMKADAEMINRLQKENEDLRKELASTKTTLTSISTKLKRSTGFYAGAFVGYPFPLLGISASYRFAGWEPFIEGLYFKNSPAVNFGIKVKIK